MPSNYYYITRQNRFLDIKREDYLPERFDDAAALTSQTARSAAGSYTSGNNDACDTIGSERYSATTYDVTSDSTDVNFTTSATYNNDPPTLEGCDRHYDVRRNPTPVNPSWAGHMTTHTQFSSEIGDCSSTERHRTAITAHALDSPNFADAHFLSGYNPAAAANEPDVGPPPLDDEGDIAMGMRLPVVCMDDGRPPSNADADVVTQDDAMPVLRRQQRFSQDDAQQQRAASGGGDLFVVPPRTSERRTPCMPSPAVTPATSESLSDIVESPLRRRSVTSGGGGGGDVYHRQVGSVRSDFDSGISEGDQTPVHTDVDRFPARMRHSIDDALSSGRRTPGYGGGGVVTSRMRTELRDVSTEDLLAALQQRWHYECAPCKSFFTDRQTLELHQRQHSHDGRFQCRRCGVVCYTAVQYNDHLLKVHRGHHVHRPPPNG